MKYLKIASLVAAGLMAIVASASATTITSPAGTTYTGAIKAESQLRIQIHTAAADWCFSKFELSVESHGAGVTVKGPVSSYSVFNCENNTTFTILKPGSFEVHTQKEAEDSHGRLTWTGAEMTTVGHSVFGTIDCTYQISPSFNATITGSKVVGEIARRVDMIAPWQFVKGSAFCSKAMEWTAEYDFTSPKYIDVD